jgi:hypothetical protein
MTGSCTLRRNVLDSGKSTIRAASRHVAGTLHAMVYLWASALSEVPAAKNAEALADPGDES